MKSRTDLLVVNQVLGPLMLELLGELSRQGIRCEALTGWADAESPADLPFPIRWAARLRKSPGRRRIWTWGAFTFQALWSIVRRRDRHVLVTTNPPWTMLAMPLLKRLCGLRYVLLVLDVYPDVAERMGLLRRDGLIARLWRASSRRALLKADGVITLGERMAETLRRHLRAGEHRPIEIIPDWVDTEFIRPLDKYDNPFAREHDLTDKFVVAYSGSFGATHDLESILEAAAILSGEPDVVFVLIGGGTRRREVERWLAERPLPNVRLLPFQPLAVLPYSLAAADCAVVCLGEGFEGVSVPSKTYYALAAGAAVLAVCGEGSELADIVRRHGCGMHVLPRHPQDLADAIRRLRRDRVLLERCKAAARAASRDHYDRRIALRRYAALLRETFGLVQVGPNPHIRIPKSGSAPTNVVGR